MENDVKRDREYDNRREKERDKKSPSPFDDRPIRNELKDARFNRESRESLREESYVDSVGSWNAALVFELIFIFLLFLQVHNSRRTFLSVGR